MRQLVRDVNSIGSDLIVLLGDLFHRPHHAERYLPVLSDLSAKWGVWATLGNHEHAHMWVSGYLSARTRRSPEQWREMYADAGIELLVNEARAVERNGSRIWLVGVDDAYSGRDDLEAALKQVEDGGFRLALTHSPDLIDDPRISEVDLLLAGHTHGGQINLPLLWPLYLECRKPRQRAAGFVRENGTIMYVTRGAGEGMPIRIGCPREITVMEIRRAVTGC